MNILFLTHYFPPEGNAPATRVYELARRWVRAGHRVTVVTGVPNVPNGVVYEGYRNRRIQRETIEGVEVVRVWTWIAPNKGVVRRTLNYLSFMVSGALGARTAERPDIVIATSPQFFCGWAGVFARRFHRRPFILEIRDIWPESIVTVGAMKKGLPVRAIEGLERRLYAAADRIVTVGDGYRSQLEARGVPPERITVIPNGVDRQTFSPREPDAAVPARHGLQGKRVCSYVGTIGMACGLDVVLRAARRLKEAGRRDIAFLLVGDGASRAELEAEARRSNLDNVVFTGRVAKEEVPGLLAASGACLIHLRKKDLFRTVLPSKIFEAAAMAKPIILGVEGAAAQLVHDAGAGLCIEPDNDAQLADAVVRLADDPALAARLGRGGLENIAPPYDYDALADRYLETIRQVVYDAGRNDAASAP